MLNGQVWWRSKAVWLGVLAILGGIVEYLYGVPAGASFGTIAIGVLTVIVRILTKQPLAK